jgi:gamma-glutamylcyclotransferase (GGCT)/AIG2-like uncharacterized protein YtfP
MSSLFAYGTLMCEDIMRDVSGHLGVPIPATLSDHLRLRVSGEYYPGIVRKTGRQVDGVIYQGLGNTAWERLDRFEGEMYQRVPVRVTLQSGSILQAQTYLVHPDFTHLLADTEWDLAYFLAHGKIYFERDYKGYGHLPAEED